MTVHVLGAGGHAKVIIDILKKNGEKNIFIFDDDENKIGQENILGEVVKGTIDDSHKGNKDYHLIIGIGDNKIRKKISERINGCYGLAIHPSAVIGEDVIIGEGTVIMANAVINSGSRIGKHCIINTAATIDHDCIIKDFVHVSPGAHLGGNIIVGESSWIGIGSSLKNNIVIEKDVVVGAGSVVIQDIKQHGVYIGIPAKRMEKDRGKSK